jgi:hypothetical protein
MSWGPEVQTDDSGCWYGNQLRFATRQEALDNAHDLKGRWSSVRAYRAVESDDPVSYSYHNHSLRHVGEPS